MDIVQYYISIYDRIIDELLVANSFIDTEMKTRVYKYSYHIIFLIKPETRKMRVEVKIICDDYKFCIMYTSF